MEIHSDISVECCYQERRKEGREKGGRRKEGRKEKGMEERRENEKKIGKLVRRQFCLVSHI